MSKTTQAVEELIDIALKEISKLRVSSDAITNPRWDNLVQPLREARDKLNCYNDGFDAGRGPQ